MPRFTSLHRPTGPFFLDLSNYQCDDAQYDEAVGPTLSVHGCEDLVQYSESDVYDLEDHSDSYDDEADEYFEHLRSKSLPPLEVDMDEIQAWIQVQYRDYLNYEGNDPHAGSLQYGCCQVELITSVKVKGHVSPRNQGRKPRVWWSKLAEERRP